MYSAFPNPSQNPNFQIQQSQIPLPIQTRQRSILVLNPILANLINLESHYRVAHWNVSGIEFRYLHELFGDLHTRTNIYVDNTAELIRALGGMAIGTVRDAARDSCLEEFVISEYRALPYLHMLDRSVTKVLESVLIGSAELIATDPVTCNFLQDLANKILKDVYLIESHLR